MNNIIDQLKNELLKLASSVVIEYNHNTYKYQFDYNLPKCHYENNGEGMIIGKFDDIINNPNYKDLSKNAYYNIYINPTLKINSFDDLLENFPFEMDEDVYSKDLYISYFFDVINKLLIKERIESIL